MTEKKAPKLVRLISPTGAPVSVGEEKAERLLRQGFTAPAAPKTPAKKAASSNTKKS